jgi:asparagine synthase (glutamine-hydrolysing)
VKKRLQGDVPVAAYLSGGLDSSLIAAILSKVSPGAVKDSFSITFPSRSIDESEYQSLMAKHLGTRHHSFEVTDQHIANHLQQVVNRAETPLRESYNACSLILSSMVFDQGIKAVVSGEGADELFAGYVGYRLNQQRDPACDDLEEMLEQEMRQKLWGDPHLFYEKAYQSHKEQKIYLFSEDVRLRHNRFDCLNQEVIDRRFVEGRDPLHQRSYLDFKLRMADHLLADHGDRVSFANSIECRFPFLDQNLIDFVRQIPPQWLLHNGEEKFLLKQLAKRYLPDVITQRQKFSFVAPSSAILLRHHRELVGDILAPERIKRQGYFDPETVEFLRQSYLQPDHQLNQTFEDDLLMVVLTFGIWLDEFSMPNYS